MQGQGAELAIVDRFFYPLFYGTPQTGMAYVHGGGGAAGDVADINPERM